MPGPAKDAYAACMSLRSISHPDRRLLDTVQPMSAPEFSAAEPITIVLADDHRVVRSGLRVLLESDGRFTVLGEAGDVKSTVEQVRDCRPRVLVLDLNMGGESSLDAIPQLRAEWPRTQIVVLTMQEDPAFARAALRAGALGYVLKDAADDELMNAVLLAARGQSYLNPQFGALLAAQPSEESRPDNLSPRETEVLTLIAAGLSNAEIAQRLVLGEQTVKTHVGRILNKLHLRDRAQAVVLAYESGLVRPSFP
jgi:two-component system response regulator NreC